MIGFMCFKELILVETVVRVSVVFAITTIFLRKTLDFRPRFSGKGYVAIVYVKGNDYMIHFLYMGKNEAIHLLRNTDLTEKSGTLLRKENYYHI